MEEELKEISTTEGKGDKKIEKRISVEEISNGFLVIETKNWEDEKKGWQHETTKVFSKTNPLEEATADLKSIINKNMPGA